MGCPRKEKNHKKFLKLGYTHKITLCEHDSALFSKKNQVGKNGRVLSHSKKITSQKVFKFLKKISPQFFGGFSFLKLKKMLTFHGSILRNGGVIALSVKHVKSVCALL